MRRGSGVGRAVVVSAIGGVVLTVTSACGGTGTGSGSGSAPGAGGGSATAEATPATRTTRIPGVGDRLRQRIPADSRQVVAVYGESRNSTDATVALYEKHGTTWDHTRGWPAHNGKKGWTTDHHEGDNRSPVGVFTLSDAGGVLPDPAPDPDHSDPGHGLPYTWSAAFAAPRWWPKAYWHDFDYVIAIDYNRLKGTSPNDPARPAGASKGGGIWLHMDHGSGTSACVSLSRSAMRDLLRTLDPDRHPVVVMGDRADLKA